MTIDKTDISTKFGTDAFIKMYENSPFTFGVVDIVCGGTDAYADRVGSAIAVLLCMHAGNKRVISRCSVLLPPAIQGVSLLDDELVLHAVARALAGINGKDLMAEDLTALNSIVTIARPTDLDASSLLALIERQGEDRAVIVCNAASYRSEITSDASSWDRGRVRIEEDFWVSRIHALSISAVELAKEKRIYVLLDLEQALPGEKVNSRLLESVDDCYVTGMTIESEGNYIPRTQLDAWVAQLETGRIGAVLSGIDALPALLGQSKPLIKVQLLHNTGLYGPAIEIIREVIASGKLPDPMSAAKLAKCALDGGDHFLAKQLLTPLIQAAVSPELLEIVLGVAEELADETLIDGCIARLAQLYPTSSVLARHRFNKLLSQRDYGRIKLALSEFPTWMNESDARFYAAMSTRLNTPEPNYVQIISETANDLPELAARIKLECGLDAASRGAWQWALALAMPIDHDDEGMAYSNASLGLRAMRQLMISRSDTGAAVIDPSELEEPCLEIVRYLAARPDSGQLRTTFAELLSVQISGSYGVPLLARTVLTLSGEERLITPELDELEQAGVDGDEYRTLFNAFFCAVIEWMDRESPLFPERARLPVELLEGPLESFLASLVGLFEYASERLVAEDDVVFFEKLLWVAVLVVPHTKGTEQDVDLIRTAAVKLANAGYPQKARDLAEQALRMTHRSIRRARLAWFAFADIYQRLNSPKDALIGIACALAAGTDVSLSDAWHEQNVLIRVLRDLGLKALAKEIIVQNRDLLARLGLDARYGHRVDVLDLGIRLQEVARNPTDEDVAQLVKDTAETCRRLAVGPDEIAPVAVLLAQSVLLAKQRGLSISVSDEEMLERVLSEIPNRLQEMIRVVSTTEPKADDLLAWASAIERARFAEDAGLDLRSVAMVARRLLSSDEAKINPSVSAFAIELMADHAISAPSPDEGETRTQSVPSSVEGPGSLAKTFSAEGIQVNLMALNGAGQLVRVTAEQGSISIPVIESPDVFSRQAFEKWSERYPYAYGVEDDERNAFFLSMGGLGIGIDQPPQRALLVMEPNLQRIPPNLLIASNDFIGRHTAIASVPSLSWLNAVRSAKRKYGGREVAWISTALKEGNKPALSVLAERVAYDLENHGIKLDTGAKIPKNLSGSKMVIVAAHGGTTPENRYFQVVADDADLLIPAGAFAANFCDCGLVILFVCNAGRFDRHPTGNAALGLTKELLNRGCSTVIASPWPLDTSVPPYWLPRFLEEWSDGKAAIDANFAANKAVEKAMSYSPAHCLALTVYGDPFIRKGG